MRDIKKEYKGIFGVSAALIIVFFVIRYWDKMEGFLRAGFSAAIPLIIGCVLAYVINILMGFYERWYDRLFKVSIALKIKRIVCLILALFSLIGIILLIINLVLPEFINCIAAFIRLIPGALQTAVDLIGEERVLEIFPELEKGFDFSTISVQIEQNIKAILGGVGGAVGSIMSVVSSTFSVIMNIVIGLIFSLYILLDKEGLARQCKTLISTYCAKWSQKIFYVVKVLDESFHSFIVGQCIEAFVLGALCVIGMWIFRFPYAVMIGVFIGFTALIPIAGAYIGAAVGAIMILTVSPIQAIQFLIFIVVLQQLEGNLIYPKVVGQSIGLPGIWVLAAITIGGGILGIGGMLLAVPLFAAGYRLLGENVENKKRLLQEQVQDLQEMRETEEVQEKENKEKEELQNTQESKDTEETKDTQEV